MSAELQIVGNLGQDPELRYTPDGAGVCNLSIASNRKWTGKDGQQHDETTWFRVTAFGKTAENCNQYLKKGSKVLVKGRLKPEISIFQRKDGTSGAAYEVTVTEIEFLTGTKDQGEGSF